jgi:hypothetical protein
MKFGKFFLPPKLEFFLSPFASNNLHRITRTWFVMMSNLNVNRDVAVQGNLRVIQNTLLGKQFWIKVWKIKNYLKNLHKWAFRKFCSSRLLLVSLNKQDKQYKYKVILRCVRATIAAVKKQYYIFWARVCVRACRLNYPICNAHASYYVVSYGLPVCTIFFHIMSKTPWFSENNFWS